MSDWKREKEEQGLCTRAKWCQNTTQKNNKTCEYHIQMAFQNNLKNGNKGKGRSKQWRKDNIEKSRRTTKEWRKNNPEERKVQERRYYKKNKKELLLKSKEYYLKNRKRVNNRIKSQRKTNPRSFVGAARVAFRRAWKKGATPPWVNKEEMREIYRNCPTDHHVDHIIPLKHPNVCGLHVPWNMQYLLGVHNDNKFNSFDGTPDNDTWGLSRTLVRFYSDRFLNLEFNNIKTKIPKYEAFTAHNKITTHFNPHFYEQENILWVDPQIRERLFKNREKYIGKKPHELTDVEILRGFKISGAHIGFSHHSPFWIKKFVEDYNIKSIYDPCGGWGHRLLGCHNIDYIYNDIDQESCSGSKQITEYFKIKNKTFYCEDATEFTPKEEYECVFTCPPYFDVEIYDNDTFKSQISGGVDLWLDTFWRKLIKSSMKPSVKFFCFIINHTFKERMAKVCVEEGLYFIEEYSVGSSKVKSHLNKGVKRGEFLMVFKTNI